MSHVSTDALLPRLNEIVRRDAAAPTITDTLQQLVQLLETSNRIMTWEVVPLSAFPVAYPRASVLAGSS